MTKFEVWIPSGTAVLRNTETGEEMTLASGEGPLSLGCIELAWLPGIGASAARTVQPAAGPAQTARSRPDAHAPSTDISDAAAGSSFVASEAAAFDAPSILPAGAPPALPGFVPGASPETEELPFLSPAEPMTPQPSRQFDRTLDAPLDALTREDFETVLETLARGRNEVEGELEFLQEIEAEPETIEAMEAELERIDAKFRAVSSRLLEWETLQRRRDEAMGLV